MRKNIKAALVFWTVILWAVAQFLFPCEDWNATLFSLAGHPHLRHLRVAGPNLASYTELVGGAARPTLAPPAAPTVSGVKIGVTSANSGTSESCRCQQASLHPLASEFIWEPLSLTVSQFPADGTEWNGSGVGEAEMKWSGAVGKL